MTSRKYFLLSLSVFLLPSISFSEPASVGIPVSSSLKSAVVEAFAPAPVAAKPKPAFEVELGKLEVLGEKGPVTTNANENTKGKKVVLYFWSIYCRGCVDQLQDLQNLKEEFSNQNAEIVPIHLFESSEDTVMKALAKLGISIPMYLAPDSIRQLFSVNLLPTAVVLDESKEIVARFDGEFDEEGLKIKLFSTVTEASE